MSTTPYGRQALDSDSRARPVFFRFWGPGGFMSPTRDFGTSGQLNRVTEFQISDYLKFFPYVGFMSPTPDWRQVFVTFSSSEQGYRISNFRLFETFPLCGCHESHARLRVSVIRPSVFSSLPRTVS